MLGHKSRHRRAVNLPINAAQTVRLIFRNAKHIGDPVNHARLNLIEKPHPRRVERVVQIKGPSVHVREIISNHERALAELSRGALIFLFGLSARGNLRKFHRKDAAMPTTKPAPNDAYELILHAIDTGVYGPSDRLVESELADRFGVSRTPIREALQRLETQSMLTRDGRSLIVASLDHDQMAELYTVRTALEGLAAELAAQHAAAEEIKVLFDMVEQDREYIGNPTQLSRANRRFHRQIHLASHNRYLVQQLDLVYRSMALLATTSLAAEGRGIVALEEHLAIVQAIEARDGPAASKALRQHLSVAFETRLKIDAGQVSAS